MYQPKLKYVIKDKLFIDTTTFHKIEYFNSISAYYSNDFSSGYECIKHLVNVGLHIELSINNLQFYIDCMKLSRCTKYFLIQLIILYKDIQTHLNIYRSCGMHFGKRDLMQQYLENLVKDIQKSI